MDCTIEYISENAGQLKINEDDKHNVKISGYKLSVYMQVCVRSVCVCVGVGVFACVCARAYQKYLNERW